MHKAFKRFTTILLFSFFLIVSINFAAIARTPSPPGSTQQVPSLLSCIKELPKDQGIFRLCIFAIILICILLIAVLKLDALRSPGKEGFCYNPEKDQLVSVKDNGENNTNPFNKNNKNPFSLSLLQLAWWTAIIILSYLGIFLFTEKFTNIFSSSATILLGINAGTPLINSLIDESKPEIKQKGSARTSEGLFNDILSDGNGFDFHRIQVALWTLALGFVFIYEVINSGKMPEFDSSLLALQGISSATFIGLRTTEKQENKPNQKVIQTKNKIVFDKQGQTLKLVEIKINEVPVYTGEFSGEIPDIEKVIETKFEEFEVTVNPVPSV
ncbi:hypothetical protein [Nostoc sp.]|uniref:hypothetical protein n=1 Tax=Nostoc sp. TaxID=1180 RepID=UPI002FF98185